MRAVASTRTSNGAAARDLPAEGPPFSPGLLRAAGLLALLLAIIGTGISSYLVYVKLQGQSPVCRIAHGCATVQNSEYSSILGVPVSVPGVIGYIVLGALAVAWLANWRGLHAHFALAAFYASLFGFLFSTYLTYVEWQVIDAWCIWCIGSAITMTALFATWIVLFGHEMRLQSR